jgi:tRNA A-37 threonylcarbamoyl transferase component Bud32
MQQFEARTTRKFYPRKTTVVFFDKKALVSFEQDGYRITTLPPFRNFRGLDIPWDSMEDLSDESECVNKYSASRKVVHLAAGQYGLPVEVHVKRYVIKTLFKALLHTVRKSRAREVFDMGWKLLSKKIRTPRPVWLAEAKGALSRSSILATESLAGAESAFDRWKRCTNDKQRAELLTAVGQFTGIMHDAGFCHADAKSTHLFIFPNRPSSADEFYIIDLLGGSFPRVLTPIKRAKNLFRLVRSFIPKQQDIGFLPEHRRAVVKAYAGSEVEADYWDNWVERIGRMKGQRV